MGGAASGIQLSASFSSFETLVARGEEAYPLTRDCLLSLLQQECRDVQQGAGFDEVLAQVSAQATNPNVAALLVRAASVPGLLIDTKANHLRRHIVSAVERLQPSFLSLLKIDRSAQNFEKYLALEGFHVRMLELLSGLTRNYGDLETLVSAKHDIVGGLNHSVLKSYCAPFHLKQVRPAVELVLSALAQVQNLSDTLLSDIQSCEQVFSNVQSDLAELDSFLVQVFNNAFLPMCRANLASFLAAQRGRFTALVQAPSANTTLPRRYTLGTPGREVTITVPLRNAGLGLATNAAVTAAVGDDNVVLGSESVNLGNVAPGPFSVSFQIMLVKPVSSFDLLVHVEWGEIFSPERRSSTFTFTVAGQRNDLDWDAWEYKNPYNTEVAEGAAFVGRTEQVRRLSAKLLSRPMEAFYITGQKRVGKTSLALAAVQQAQQNTKDGTLASIYILWGNVAHSDPVVSLKRLGHQIDKEVRKALSFTSASDAGLYDGSIAPLVDLLNLAMENSPETRFSITIDEFDEMPPELFLSGNLAETFFANLRAISRCKNASLILVGGENMPFVMDRQGQKLNNFARFDLSYFARDSEYSDYQMVVRNPSSELLNWQDDAIAEIFNLTNGNPYFTKLICSAILSQAFSERDAEITFTEVHNAATRNLAQLGSNSFAHLWQDGIPKRLDEREVDITRRLRVLTALARCTRKAIPTTAQNIVLNKPNNLMAESDFSPVLNDFVRRKVLTESDRGYSFVLPIFQMWLADVGLSQLIANNLGDELASSMLERENAATVTAAEVSSLAKSWPTYRGRVIGADDIRAWLQQVESVFDQRILFNLLSRTLIVGEPFIRERLQTAHSMVRRSLPEFIIRKKTDRRKDLIVTYVDGEGKSGSHYASLYAEENGISTDSILAPTDFAKTFYQYSEKNGSVKAVVVIDDVVATGESLSNNLKKFWLDNGALLTNVALRVVSLFSTNVGDKTVKATIRELGHRDAEYRSCEVLPEKNYAFPETGNCWSNDTEQERARALVNDLGSPIYPKNPLGFGNMGLLLVLPTTVPNNTLPILHSAARAGAKSGWTPLFPRILN